MMGGSNNLEWSVSQEFQPNKDTDIGFEISPSGLNSTISYKINKHVSVQGNFELGNPFEKAGKKGPKTSMIKRFGVGLKMDSKEASELFANQDKEDDLSEYAMDS